MTQWETSSEAEDEREGATDEAATEEPARRGTERGLRAAIEIYTRWENERERSPLDRLVSGEFRTRRYLNAGERRWISEAIYSSVRYLRRQTFLLDALGLPHTPENRLHLWAALLPPDERNFLALNITPETASDAFARLPGEDNPREHLRVTLAFPDALADELESLLGAEALAAALALNRQAPTTLRINPLRARFARVQNALPDATPTRFSPWGLELPRRINVSELTGFREGWFEVQEEASQLALFLTDAAPGQTIVEVGAGAGGKTLGLAVLMHNKGRLVACDTHAGRLEALQKRAHRAGIAGVETCLLHADATTGEWQPSPAAQRKLNQLTARSDLVFVDAPCSGSGALRRSPDAKWRDNDLPAFAAVQQTLLRQAAALVKDGGRLLYVTCAIERSQNEDVVNAFLASPFGAGFVVEPVAPMLDEGIAHAAELAGVEWEADPALWQSLTTGPYLRTWPHRHGMDAFFAASLRKA